MAVIVKSKTGKSVTLLNPEEKKAKYQSELKRGRRLTNNGSFKLINGKSQTLTKEQRAYRAGFVSGVIDCQKAHVSKKRKR